MKVTLKDIAEQVNVSISTVSRVLNHAPCSIHEETRARIFQIAEELGYQSVKKTEQTNRNFSEKQVGCILNDLKDKYHDPYFSEMIYGIERELLNQGYAMSFTYDAQDLKQTGLLQELSPDDYAGIICIGPMETKLLKEISSKTSVLLSVGGTPELDIDYVTVDFKKASKAAVNHLLDLGHRSIAWIGGNMPLSDITMKEEMRFLGYKEALEERGIPVLEQFVENGEFDMTGGYRAMKRILSGSDLPTALFTASDRMAYGAYKAIQEEGLSIPGEIAVASFDDLEMSQIITPSLTTVRVHKEEMGRIAVKLLIQRIEGHIPLPMTCYLPTQLMIRESSSANGKGD